MPIRRSLWLAWLCGCPRRLSRLIFSTVRGGFGVYPLRLFRLFRPRDPFPAALSGVRTLPFLVPRYRPAVLPDLAVIASGLPGLAWTGRRFCGTGLLASFVPVTLGGAVSVSPGTVR